MKSAEGRPESVKVLLADDDEAALRSLRKSLGRRGQSFEFLEAHSAEQALNTVKQQRPLAAVVDLSIDPVEGPESGLRLIAELSDLAPARQR